MLEYNSIILNIQRRPQPGLQLLLVLIAFKAYICMYGHTYSRGMDQPGKVASPARGQLNSISLSAFVPENLVSRDGFGSPVPRQPAHLRTQTESGAYLRDSSRVPRRRPFIHS